MAKRTTGKSVTLTNEVLARAMKRAVETARGNFSAYVENLINRDLLNSLKKKAKQ